MNNIKRLGSIFPILFYLLMAINLLFLSYLAYLGSVPKIEPVINVLPPKLSLQSAPVLNLDSLGISKSINQLDSSVKTLSIDIKRLNTTSLQFQYLSREVDRLDETNDLVIAKLGQLKAPNGIKRTGESEKAIVELEKIKKSVQASIMNSNKLITSLIGKLEIVYEDSNNNISKSDVNSKVESTDKVEQKSN